MSEILKSLCLDAMSRNSILVVFKVSLLAISQLLTFARSTFKYDSMVSALPSAWVRYVLSGYILGLTTYEGLLGSLFNIQFGYNEVINYVR